jgi:glycoprotein-N-acetylgalactosamine 3-beta-galactosyltransferase
VALPVGAGRGQLWHKTLEIYKYVSHCKPTWSTTMIIHFKVYKHHLNDADWFMKLDDDK